jgi:hypothetical protein
VEQDLRAHSKSLSELVMFQNALGERITELEHDQHQRALLEARKEERDVAMKTWQASVDKRLESIQGVGTKLLWIVATGVIGVFLAFIVRGGMAP